MAPNSPEPLSTSNTEAAQARLTRSFLILAGCLTLMLGGLSLWEHRQIHNIALNMAATDCRSNLNKDLVYRRWASIHGGVYVPMTEQTPANPYLSHIPERDITTPSGKKLTLMNPAYMTRQVNELAQEQYGTQGHITSLNPLRPENAPDAWEAKALEAFASGATEVLSLELIDKHPYLRLMRPMTTEPGCLKCHAKQGYKVGDIRGGISVSTPFTPYLKSIQAQSYPVYLSFDLLWMLGLLALGLTKRKFAGDLLIKQQADQVLEASEARYRIFFENNTSTMLLIDPESGAIIDANPAASAYYGWTLAELKQMNIAEINTLSPEEIAIEMALAKRHSRNYFVMKHRRADGTVRDVEIYSGPLQTPDRTLLFSIVHDIGKRREAEKKLQESETLYHDLVATSQDLIWQCDADGRYTYLNPAWEKTFGYRLEEMLGRKFSDFQRPEDAARDLEEFAKLLAGGSTKGLSSTHLSKNGEALRLVFNATSVHNEAGRITGTRGTAYDITERLQQEEQIRHSLHEKEVMLKEIHHRVKNNLQVIYSLLNLQAMGIADSAVRAMFEESKNRVNSMALIHERLYQSKDLASIDFNDYLKQLVSGIAGTYRRSDISIQVEPPTLHLDVNISVPCGLIVNELVSNSLKHAFPQGRSGTISLGLKRTSEGRNVLTVGDNGVGLPATVDFRNTTSLGLQLVTVLAGQIHGTIEVSREGGTTFVITFPGAD